MSCDQDGTGLLQEAGKTMLGKDTIMMIVIKIITITMSFYLIKYHAVNTYGERKYYSTHCKHGNCKVIG